MQSVHCPGCLQPLQSRTNQLTSKWSYSEWTTLINNSIQQAEAGMPKAGLPQGKSHRNSCTIYSVIPYMDVYNYTQKASLAIINSSLNRASQKSKNKRPLLPSGTYAKSRSDMCAGDSVHFRTLEFREDRQLATACCRASVGLRLELRTLAALFRAVFCLRQNKINLWQF